MPEHAGAEAVPAGGQTKVARRHLARAPRRRMALGRGGVLVVEGRSHIVGLRDVSVTGAFLMTGAPVAEGDTCVLKLAPVKGRVQLAVSVRVVRVVAPDAEMAHQPRGVAVQFLDTSADTLELLGCFVGRGPDLVP